MFASASSYDTDNVHSLIKTLPGYLSHDNDMDNRQFRSFVNMMGEHFDLIKSYVDGYEDLYKNQYGEAGYIPDNLLPIIAQKDNWQFRLPFGDNTDSEFLNFYGSSLSNLDVTTNHKNNIWKFQKDYKIFKNTYVQFNKYIDNIKDLFI